MDSEVTPNTLQAENARLRERISELTWLEEAYQHSRQELDALYDTTTALLQGLDLDQLLDTIITRAGRLVNTNHGYVALINEAETELTFRAGRGVFAQFQGSSLKPGEGLTGRVWMARQPLIINDYDSWSGHVAGFVEKGIKAITAVPLMSEDAVPGVLGMVHNTPDRIFDARAVSLLERFAPLASLAVQNARVYEQMQTDLAERTRTEALIREQAATLRQLSTPLIPISAHAVALPLIGQIDEQRAQQILETLLEGVARRQASIAIVDITGVAVVDTHVADVLLQAARAVRLLGARVILTGIRPDVAQTLVSLGIDMSGLHTTGTLQSGIAQALRAQA